MGKALHLPGIFFLFSAFVLLLLVSISLPYLTVFDFARVHFNEGGPISIGSDSNAVSQLRVRIRQIEMGSCEADFRLDISSAYGRALLP